MDFQELAAKGYSARDFSQMPIPKAVIDQILMAGNAAPTAHNNQPQEIIVVHSQEGIELLKKLGYTDAELSKEHFHRRDLEEYVTYR